MRVTLLARDDAARVITGAVSTLAWAAGAVIIVMTVPVLIETLFRAGRPDAIPVPLAMLLVIGAGIVVSLKWMQPWVVVGYLVGASAATVIYQVQLYHAGLGLFGESAYLINRPVLALVTIGVAATTVVGGVMWCVAGYIVGIIVTVTTAMIAGEPASYGWGPSITLGLAVVTYLTLFAIQRRQRRKLPRYDELEAATKRRSAGADLARRTTAIVHDTVLNDLAFVMNAPDILDERSRTRLLKDLATLEDGAWMRTAAQLTTSDDEQTRIRNAFTRLASEFRWKGLTVNVTGAGSGVFRYAPGAGDALVGAVSATLENVLKHSGTSSADVEIMYSADEITFMVSDQGEGFDTATVSQNRLGIRDSIVGRIEDVGGRVRIWSSPGAGTTVLISVPIAQILEPGEPSRHQEGDYGA